MPTNYIGILMAQAGYYLLDMKDLQKFLDVTASKMTVYAPVKSGKGFNFSRLEGGRKIDLKGYTNTEFPPRGILMPEGETLLKYGGHAIREVFDDGKRVIFGIRPCDVHAITVLDKVMMGHGDIEEHYEAKRKNTLIVALKCIEAGENCFCESMGTHELTEDFDLLFTEAGSEYHVEVGSPEGAKLVKAAGKIFTRTPEKSANATPGCKKKIDTDGLNDMMKRAAKSRIWEDVARRCLSCASCTAVCPTCFCFSLKHEPDIADLKKGEIKREMDYCMLLRFSRVAGDFVFRQHRAERLKQFFYHKLVYGFENEGRMHCVGCGRCITECMAGIDITDEVARVRQKYGKAK
jgi:sulfhydrogenase subunit beta (sulfur reductase)